MPTSTPNLSLTLYDRVTDNNVLFIDFRDALAGLTASNMTKIDTAVGLRATLVSPTFTGTPSAPTAAPGTNTDQLATTAFVLANSTTYSHPTGDGNLHVPATSTTNSGKVLTAGGTAGSLSWQTPATIPSFTATATDIKMDGTQSVGALSTIARADHVHPSDTSRQPLGNELTALQALADTAGFVKKTGDGAYTIDTATYNNYTHPANHPPSIITQDINNRFVTDAEKIAWNAKQETLVSGTSIKTVNGVPILGSGDMVIQSTSPTWIGTQAEFDLIVTKDPEIIYYVTDSVIGATVISAKDTPPLNPTMNELWFDSSSGKLRIYYNDGSSYQWVEVIGATVPNIADNSITKNQLALDIQETLNDIDTPEQATITLDETTQITKVTDSYSGIADLVLKGDTLFNAPVNGNFANGTTGLIAGLGANLSVANKILSITGTVAGSAPYVGISAGKQQGQKEYAKTRVRVTNSLCQQIRLEISGITITLSNPVVNQWYDLVHIFTLLNTGANATLYIQHAYADATTANGKVMEVDGNVGVFAIPITGTPYENMTATEINNKIGAYFEGLKGATLETVGSRGKNLFGKTTLEVGALESDGTESVNNARCRTRFIRVKQASYRLTKTTMPQNWFAVHAYDINGRWLSQVIDTNTLSSTITFPVGTSYARIKFDDTLSDVLQNSVQLEEGTLATAYEPFDGSQVSISAARHKLPNLIEDSLEFVDGKWLYYKRTAEYTLLSADITQLYTGHTNLDQVGIVRSNIPNVFAQTSPTPLSWVIPNFRAITVPFVNSTSIIGTYMDDTLHTAHLWLHIAKGTYANLAAAQTALAGTKIVYQLATPLVIEEKDFSAYNITIDGSLSANNGETEFYVRGYDILADSLVTYPMNIASGTESLKESVEGIQKQIGVGSVIRSTTAPITLYVRTDGSDSNDGSEDTPSKAIKTIQSAIDRLPKYLKHNVTINVGAGTYTEDVLIRGFVGEGTLAISGDTIVSTSRSIRSLALFGCSAYVFVKGFNVTINTANAQAIGVRACIFAAFHYMNVIASGTLLAGFIVATGANADIRYSVISNKDTAIYAQNGKVSSYLNSGTGNTYSLYATGGGHITKLDTQPSGPEYASAGGLITGEELTTTITSGFAAGWSGTVTVRKSFDNLTSVYIDLAKSTDISAGYVTLFTLPVGVRPLDIVVQAAVILDSGTGVIVGNDSYTYISTNGVTEICGAGTLTNARKLKASFMYYSA